MQPPRMRIAVMGRGGASLVPALMGVGHQVVQSARDADMVIIGEASAQAVALAAESLPSVRGKIVAHMCGDLPPLELPGAVSIVLSRLLPGSQYFIAKAHDELGYGICELLAKELDFWLINPAHQQRFIQFYDALVNVQDFPEELLMSLVREVKG